MWHSLRTCGGAGGRCLFMGTDGGALRSYKLPLGPDFQEARCSAGAVSRMRLGHEDAQLFVTSADGSLFVFDVRDRDPARGAGKRCGAAHPLRGRQSEGGSMHACMLWGPCVGAHQCRCKCRDAWLRRAKHGWQHAMPCARRETGDKLAYAEEVLVSKADLEENKQRIAELDAQVLAERARGRTVVQPPVCALQRTHRRIFFGDDF